MPATQKLSEVVIEIEETMRNRFAGRSFWIKAEITDVKKYVDKKWCFLKFIEKDGGVVTTEMKGVFWSNTYYNIENFESATGQAFASGLEITCQVRVKFHKRYGLNLEVTEIDFAYAIGKLELERKQTIDRLINERILTLDVSSGQYYSNNTRLGLPIVFQRIALITAPDSDGQRDFMKVVCQNKYGFAFSVTEFLTRVQGDAASGLIIAQLQKIEAEKDKFDIVVIVRGGGSDTDFKSFNDFELAKAVGNFPVPVLTGIGHDRNTSITDLVARQLRTPTEVGSYIVDHNLNFDREVEELKLRLYRRVDSAVDRAKNNLESYRQRIINLSPATVLKKGFAIVTINGKIVTDPAKIQDNSEIMTILKDTAVYSNVTKKQTNDHEFDL